MNPATVLLGAVLAFIAYLLTTGDAQASMAPDDNSWGDASAPPDSPPGDLGGGIIPSITAIFSTRGEKNNNPGNVRLGSGSWLGQVSGADPSFVTFDNPQDGIRAAAKILKNYQAVYHLNTVRGIVNRWAPSTENNTAAYISAVAGEMGVGPDDPLDLNDLSVLTALTTAIIHHENGRVIYSDADIATAVRNA